MRLIFASAALLTIAAVEARAQQIDLSALNGDGESVSISGVSSGAAMAVQYAIAHSDAIAGVGSIAGPGWDCAEGSLAKGMNDCMCGHNKVSLKPDKARQLAEKGEIARLSANNAPIKLQRSYVFQSPADATVVEQSGQASIDFLRDFIKKEPVVDFGNKDNGSRRAGHGIINPDGPDSCEFNGAETTYVRKCGNEDNAGNLFHALFAPEETQNPATQRKAVPLGKVLPFQQQKYIDKVLDGDVAVSPDDWRFFGLIPWTSERRKHLDMDATGYIYVPPDCTNSTPQCRVHIALHGCKQDGEKFAKSAGYNNWADYYKVIVVYPAIKQSAALVGEACKGQMPIDLPFAPELNPNGCWDWWGYLDPVSQKERYVKTTVLQKSEAGKPKTYKPGAPQMQVIEAIIADVTKKQVAKK